MKTLLPQVESILKTGQSTAHKLKEVCTLLNKEVPRYTWVGFYFMDHRKAQLRLGPYVGAPTDHVIIPFGKGICGQVATSGETYLAEDVEEEGNYIACSVDVRSEIVIPVYDGEKLVAQLDIDSSQLNAFSPSDQEELEKICECLGKEMGSEMHYTVFFKD